MPWCEPYGAHPSYVQGYYDRDNESYLAWDKLSQDHSAVLAWLDEWVYGLENHAAYVRNYGQAHLIAQAGAFARAVG